jgi:hypothetical protein
VDFGRVVGEVVYVGVEWRIMWISWVLGAEFLEFAWICENVGNRERKTGYFTAGCAQKSKWDTDFRVSEIP